MNAEFTKKCAEMLNNFAASGGAVLAVTGKDAAVAALPDTDPPLFAAVGTVEGIRKVLPVFAAEQPGVLTDERINDLLIQVGPTAGIYRDSRDLDLDKIRQFARSIEREVAAHLASQSQEATIPCCGDPNCYDCDRVPVKVAAPTQASTAQAEMTVPDGFALMPKRLTKAMEAACLDAAREYREETGGLSFHVIYDAAVESAPAAPAIPSQGKADSLNEGVGKEEPATAAKVREAVARAIWNIRRDDEDRCDMELEDMGHEHSVWAEADAAIRALKRPAGDTGEQA